MRTEIFKIFIIILFALSAVFFHPPTARAHIPGKEYMVTGPGGKIITLTSRMPSKGDEIIKANGDHYIIISTKDNSAEAVLKDKKSIQKHLSNSILTPVSSGSWNKRPIGIYHTHTDESYINGDGVSSKPSQGGIIHVGETFSKELEKKGIKTIHDRTPHDPHDVNAYYRSRRTAANILKQNPIAIFDIHRDGIQEPGFYKENVSGKEVTQIRLVVGRQNPKMDTNLDFAKRLMDYANKKHPELVKEIYKAEGDYNQDLLSTSVLVEAGTYTNEKEEAKNGMALLADAVPVVLGLTPQDRGMTGKEGGQTGKKVSIILTIVLLAVSTAFLFINKPGKVNEIFLTFLENIKPYIDYLKEKLRIVLRL